MNEWLVDSAPRTLREACQFLAWFQSIDRMWAAGGALGQLDELLRPYYEADVAAGRITDDEEVVWYIASLFFNDTHYSQIGGPAPDGHDLTSRMSFLILEAMHRLRIPANLAVRVHDRLDPELLRQAVGTSSRMAPASVLLLLQGPGRGLRPQRHPDASSPACAPRSAATGRPCPASSTACRMSPACAWSSPSCMPSAMLVACSDGSAHAWMLSGTATSTTWASPST